MFKKEEFLGSIISNNDKTGQHQQFKGGGKWAAKETVDFLEVEVGEENKIDKVFKNKMKTQDEVGTG